MPTNQQIINKAGTAIQTGSLTHGLYSRSRQENLFSRHSKRPTSDLW